jgi:nitroreductase
MKFPCPGRGAALFALLRRAGTWQSLMGPGSAAHRFALRRVRGTKASWPMDASVNQKQDRIGVLEELLHERYSCRAFKPDPVPRETIEHILKVAQRTASWCNSQPWQVLIASGEARERFRKLIYTEAASGAGDDHDFTPPREYLGVYLERRRESGFQLYNTLGIPRGDKAAYGKQALENYNFFGAPHVAIIHTTEPLGIYGAIDCGAYVGNFMLAAQALGLGTIAQAALARHSGLIRRHFKLGDDRRVVCGISFGFADHAHKVNSYRTSRAGIADTVTFIDA